MIKERQGTDDFPLSRVTMPFRDDSTRIMQMRKGRGLAPEECKGWMDTREELYQLRVFWLLFPLWRVDLHYILESVFGTLPLGMDGKHPLSRFDTVFSPRLIIPLSSLLSSAPPSNVSIIPIHLPSLIHSDPTVTLSLSQLPLSDYRNGGSSGQDRQRLSDQQEG